MRIIRQQRDREVTGNSAFGVITNYEQSVVTDEDVAWLHEYNHMVYRPAAGSLANRKHTNSRPPAN
jgi:hypothetical protein